MGKLMIGVARFPSFSVVLLALALLMPATVFAYGESI